MKKNIKISLISSLLFGASLAVTLPIISCSTVKKEVQLNLLVDKDGNSVINTALTWIFVVNFSAQMSGTDIAPNNIEKQEKYYNDNFKENKTISKVYTDIIAKYAIGFSNPEDGESLPWSQVVDKAVYKNVKSFNKNTLSMKSPDIEIIFKKGFFYIPTTGVEIGVEKKSYLITTNRTIVANPNGIDYDPTWEEYAGILSPSFKSNY